MTWCVSGIVQRAARHRAESCCDQPDKRTQLGSDGGLRAAALLALSAGYRAEVWWWDAVLLLRRLLLTSLSLALHQAPVMQAVVALLLLICFLSAHFVVQPMESGATNALEAAYLCSLLALSGLSIRAGALLSVSVQDSASDDMVLVGTTVLLYAAPGAALLCACWSQLAPKLAAWRGSRARWSFRQKATMELREWTMRPGAV